MVGPGSGWLSGVGGLMPCASIGLDSERKWNQWRHGHGAGEAWQVNVDGLAVRFIVEVVERGDVQPAMSLPGMAFLAEGKWCKRTLCAPSSIVVRECIVDSVARG